MRERDIDRDRRRDRRREKGEGWAEKARNRQKVTRRPADRETCVSATYPKTGKKQTQGVGGGGNGDVERASRVHRPCSGRVSALRAAFHPFPRILKSSLSRSPLRLSLNRQRLAEVSVASEGAWVGAGDGQDWSAGDTGRAGRTRGLRFRGCESQVSRAGWLN